MEKNFRPNGAGNITAGSARPAGSNTAPTENEIDMRNTLDAAQQGQDVGACARGPRRIQLSRKRGYRKPPGAIVVARRGFWGNPWQVGVHGDRAMCVKAHADWLAGKRDDAPDGKSAQEVIARIGELRGRDLACWCGPDAQCHADTLIALANRGGK